MIRSRRSPRKSYADSESGWIRGKAFGHLRVVLVYPNTYRVGMANLGFQTVYGMLNELDRVVCERAFLPDDHRSSGAIVSVESESELGAFDVVAFSFSFEADYPNLPTVLANAGIPLQSAARDASHPMIIAGGAACFINPEPIASFIDCFFIGEAETTLPLFFEDFDPSADRRETLWKRAIHLPGIYAPAFYQPEYRPDGTLHRITASDGAPGRVRRTYPDDLSSISTRTRVMTPHTAFDGAFLIETSRGCVHGCRFCAAGFVYRPPRMRSVRQLEADMRIGETLSDRIGLVGAAISDLPGLGTLCRSVDRTATSISFSSFRADAITPEIIGVLKQSRVKTAAIAPETGSERLRRVINKNLDEADILNGVERLVEGGVPNIRLYFMVGLPTETMEDVDAVVNLCLNIKRVFLNASRERKRIGRITVSLNPFIPKPFTPFQWAPMAPAGLLKKKMNRVAEGLRREANVDVQRENPRSAYIQAVLARGDRRVSELLTLAHELGGNWPQALGRWDMHPDFYALRERRRDELFPWEVIDSGVSRSFLRREYDRALKGRTSPPCPMKACRACGVCMPAVPGSGADVSRT